MKVYMCILKHLFHIERRLRKIIMNQTEFAAAITEFATETTQNFSDLNTQLAKALDEILKAIQKSGEVSPEVLAAFDNAKAIVAQGNTDAKAKAQELDDLNEDAPPPGP